MIECEPSRVIHFRNVTPEVTQSDLVSLAASFGNVQTIVIMRDKNQALMEMNTLADAMSFVEFYRDTGYAFVNGRKVYLKYSKHQALKERSRGKVLLVTLHRPDYTGGQQGVPVTAYNMYQIFSPYGAVVRVVIPSNCHSLHERTQALVEFTDANEADKAKNLLQGQKVQMPPDINFTLDVQYSNLQQLTVRGNGPFSLSFNTNPSSFSSPQYAVHPTLQVAGQTTAVEGLPPAPPHNPNAQAAAAAAPSATASTPSYTPEQMAAYYLAMQQYALAMAQAQAAQTQATTTASAPSAPSAEAASTSASDPAAWAAWWAKAAAVVSASSAPPAAPVAAAAETTEQTQEDSAA